MSAQHRRPTSGGAGGDGRPRACPGVAGKVTGPVTGALGHVGRGLVTGVVSAMAGAVTGVSGVVTTTAALLGADLTRAIGPAAVARAGVALLTDGATASAVCALNAARFGDAPAVIDEAGSISFTELRDRVRTLTDALAGIGVGRGDRIGVLCRNHRGFVTSVFALSSTGADVVLLNTSSAPAEVAAVAVHEGLTGLVHDAEFAPHAAAATEFAPLRVWTTRPGDPTGPGIEDLGVPARRHLRLVPPTTGRFVLLTSGTTGAPKGAARGVPTSLDPLVSLLARIPLHGRDVTMVGSPLFHAWGFAQLGLSLVLSSTLVVQPRFDAEAVLAQVERHRVRVLTVVPVMVKRLADLPAATRRRYDTSSLVVVASSGAHLPGPLAGRFMEAYGDVLYNVYGSTETGFGAIATPEDLRAAPGTAGTPPWHTQVRIVDDAGAVLPPGSSGHVLVRSRLLLDHYTDGRRRPRLEGFMDTGDVGRLHQGRLFVEGRRDDMVVSGGENVYPQEVEDLIAAHPGVDDVAVVAVDDAEFGQRLRALVVKGPGASLTADDIRSFVRQRLARYKVPREVLFLDTLPHNEVGKLVRSDPHRN